MATSKKARSSAGVKIASATLDPSSAEERRAAGKRLRDTTPREAHAEWRPPAKHADPIALLRAADTTRVPELVPIRYGRMLVSPFTFYRGSAAVMAADLADTPATGIRVQACGDVHLLNFGGFATPERTIVFDINDFDETLPAPWEWDVKRLAASFVLAARSNGLADTVGREAAAASASSYRKHVRDYSDMTVLEIWYSRIDSETYLATLPAHFQAILRKRIEKATAGSSSDLVFPKLAQVVDGEPRIHDDPPLIFHHEMMREKNFMADAHATLAQYRETLANDRRMLLDRYKLVDTAMKVVGIGSVGTLCLIGLFIGIDGHPLFLQLKEAGPSALEAYAGKSLYPHHGQRVVEGQRLMQPASDIFLGWMTGTRGRQYYLRQLRDVKLSALVETFDAEMLKIYAGLCGWALAHAHSKAGDPWTIAGYLGKGDEFDHAISKFAVAYADQAERDHDALKSAVRSGTVQAIADR
jgi:uncharacterized protein (DUF2252 family)